MKKYVLYALIIFLVFPSVQAIQYEEVVDIQQSDTFKKVTQETYTVSYIDNETGENVTEERTRTTKETTDLIEIRDISIERIGNSKNDEPAKKVRSRIEIYPSELGQRLIGNEDVSMYEMNGEPISQKERQELKKEMSDLSISYKVGGSGKSKGRPINAKNGKTYNIVSNLENGKAKFDIGSRTTTITISSQTDFNSNGTHTRTSSDRDDESGRLGLGYTYASTSGSWLPQNQDIIAQYELSEDFGTSSNGDTVSDRSGNGRSGTTSGGVDTTANGIFNTSSYSFDDSNDYVDTGFSSDSFNYSSGISITGWVKTTETSLVTLTGHRNTNTNNGFIIIQMNEGSTGDIRLTIRDSSTGNEFEAQGGSSMTNGVWKHFAAVYDGNNMDIYIDSQNVGTNSNVGSISPGSTHDFWIGALNNQGSYQEGVNGNMNDVIYFDRALSQSEIEDLYFQGQDGTFNGNYESDNLRSGNSTTVGWDEFNVSTNLNSQDVNATVEVSDDDFSTVKDSTTFTNVVDGLNSFDISTLQDGDDVRVRYDYTSTDVTQTSEVTSYNISSGSGNGTDTTPPNISIDSPSPQTYVVDAVDLNVSANEPIDTWKYNLNGTNQTFTPNKTLTDLTDGDYNLTVYANDTSGNTGSSSVDFIIEEPLKAIFDDNFSTATFEHPGVYDINQNITWNQANGTVTYFIQPDGTQVYSKSSTNESGTFSVDATLNITKDRIYYTDSQGSHNWSRGTTTEVINYKFNDSNEFNTSTAYFSTTQGRSLNLTNPYPSNNAKNVSVDTNLSVDYESNDGVSGDVSFYWNNNTLIETVNGVSSGSTATTSQLSLQANKTYDWFANVTDDDGYVNSSSTYNFTTVNALVANVNTNTTSGQEPLTISYNVTESGGTSPYTYDVSFGDGSSNSTSSSGTHTYNSKGVYTLKATVTDNTGDTATASQDINVTGTVNFTSNITSTNSPVVEGEVANVTSEITNVGSDNGSQTVTLRWNTEGNQVDSQNVQLNSGESKNITLSYTTSNAGNYTTWVKTNDDSSNTTFEVTKPDDYFSVNITGSNTPVAQGSIANVDAEITNNGSDPNTQTVGLAWDTQGNTVDTQSLTLNASDGKNVTFSYDTTGESVGNYTTYVSSDDETKNTTVRVESSTNVLVNVSAYDSQTKRKLQRVKGNFTQSGNVRATINESNYTKTLNVTSGTYDITVDSPFYQPKTITKTLSGGEQINVSLDEKAFNQTISKIPIDTFENYKKVEDKYRGYFFGGCCDSIFDWNLVTNQTKAYQGTTYLNDIRKALDGSHPNGYISSDGDMGLNYYPKRGDTIRWNVYFKSESGVLGTKGDKLTYRYFFFQDIESTTFDKENARGYSVNIGKNSSDIKLLKHYKNGSQTVLDSVSSSNYDMPIDQWVEGVVRTNKTHLNFTFYNASNTKVTSVEAKDDEYNYRGFSHFGNSTDPSSVNDYEIRVDNHRVTKDDVKINITAIDIGDNTSIQNFTGNLYNPQFNKNYTFTTTNGQTNITVPSNLKYQANINAPTYADFNTTQNITPTQDTNLQFQLYKNNTIELDIFNVQGQRINTNTNVTFDGPEFIQTNTSNGNLLQEQLLPGQYKVRINNPSYSTTTYFFKVTSNTYQQQNVYLQQNTADVTISVVDQRGNNVDDAIVNIQRRVNGTIRTVFQDQTDFSGNVITPMRSDRTYIVNVDSPRFSSFSGDIQPVEPEYQIVLSDQGASFFETVFDDVNYNIEKNYNNQTNNYNISFEVFSKTGTLKTAEVTATWNNTDYTSNITNNAMGGITTVTIPNVNGTVDRKISANFSIDTTIGDTSFDRTYWIDDFTSGITSLPNVFGGINLGQPANSLIAALIVAMTVTAAMVISRSILAGSLAGFVMTGLLSTVFPLFPLLAGLITVNIIGAMIILNTQQRPGGI